MSRETVPPPWRDFLGELDAGETVLYVSVGLLLLHSTALRDRPSTSMCSPSRRQSGPPDPAQARSRSALLALDSSNATR